MINRCVLAVLIFFLPHVSSAQLEMLDTTGLAKLKQTTTVFLVPHSDSVLRASYEQAINSSWTLTPHIIITPDQLADYTNKPGYSFFCEICNGHMPQSQNQHFVVPAGNSGAAFGMGIAAGVVGSALVELVWIRQTQEGKLFGAPKGYYSFFQLFTMDTNSKGPYMKRFAMIKMGMARGDEQYAEIAHNHWKIDRRHGATDSFKVDSYWNPYWSPGLLKTYLVVASNRLAAGKNGLLFVNTTDLPAITRLRTDTLYIPDYIAPCITHEEPDGTVKVDSAIARAYPYPYRIVAAEQLSNMILQPGSNINFITYSTYQDNERMYDPTRKHDAGGQIAQGVRIYNSKTGLVYSKFTLVSDLHPKPKGTKHRYQHSPFSDFDLEMVANTIGSK